MLGAAFGACVAKFVAVLAVSLPQLWGNRLSLSYNQGSARGFPLIEFCR